MKQIIVCVALLLIGYPTLVFGDDPRSRQQSVRVQLQWVPQAQFAGVIAARSLGYYAEERLNVAVVPGGPHTDIVAEGSASDGPEFTISWVPKVLAAVESGKSDLVGVAQVFQRSGTRSIAWKASQIRSVGDFRGHKVGVWDFGNEHEIVAGARRYGLEAGSDYTKVIQTFDLEAFMSKRIDVASAMTYDGYAQFLETKDSETGRLHQPGDVIVFDWNAEGTAMLQDAVFARAAWLAVPGNRDVAVRFLRATFRGWIFCRDNPGRAVELVLAAGTNQGRGHQAWQMNEVNPLIWPSPTGIGMTSQAMWDQTVRIAIAAGVISREPAAGAFRNDLAQEALRGIDGDVRGLSFVKGTVVVTEGGR